MTIIDFYNNKVIPKGLEDYTDVVNNAFKYKIFLSKPTKAHKKWFKSCTGFDYPVELSELTSKLIKKINSIIKVREKDEKWEQKQREQRAKRGYSDSDVYDYQNWFSSITHKMMVQLAKTHNGHPMIDINGNDIKGNYLEVENVYEIADKKWTEILERIAFLAGEVNEETCSMSKERDRLLNEWGKYREQFEKEYGWGESLLTEEEKEYEKKNHVKIWVGLDRHPDKQFVKDQERAWDELQKYEKKMFAYRNKCKNELFDLLKKYYWNLWD